MLGLDTNVLVRLLVRDDEEQFERAQRLIRREAHAGTPVFVGHLVLLETE
jgi:predicted nucleic-acid-binding protein